MRDLEQLTTSLNFRFQLVPDSQTSIITTLLNVAFIPHISNLSIKYRQLFIIFFRSSSSSSSWRYIWNRSFHFYWLLICGEDSRFCLLDASIHNILWTASFRADSNTIINNLPFIARSRSRISICLLLSFSYSAGTYRDIDWDIQTSWRSRGLLI